MKISKKGLLLIEEFERFKRRPYLCPAGVPTIGIGTTVYPNGKKVELRDHPISGYRALEILKYQVDYSYGKAINRYVSVPLNQNEFDALASFTYNLGIGALRSSTLLKKLNKGDRIGASKEFKKWVNANGRRLKGLVKRRKREKNLFLTKP